ncbi:MAG: putative secreted sugar-binding protein [Microbacterium sp.]|jgi:raffinose/stachyose/melibiose transport system substrate-binding protein|uniref:ABC transporter substrate-binding protein n=1 Tax=Microbacterium sp. TaxID=51671 RepID=UPI0026300165|nr:extracellular solute-binding protein [Microbacterium sp.]MDF2562831.1 putative secreted sugar-binding protein [Microbacterium sp.]
MKIRTMAATTSIVAITALALAGCSGGGGDAPAPSDGEVSGTLTGLFFSGFQETYEEIATAFEEEYPDVTVDFDYQGGDINQLVMTQLQGGTAPDILTSFPGGDPKDNADNVAPLAANGLIAPLDVTWADDIPETWASDFSYDGEVYAYPGALQPLSAIYNQTKIDELGLSVPTTLDEILQLCADAADAGVYAYAQGLGDAAAGPQMFPFAHTATLLTPEIPDFDEQLASGEITYPDSPWVDILQIQQDLWDAGCFGEGALGRSREQAASAVAAGDALGIVDVGAVLPGMLAAAPDASFVFASVPATDDGDTFVTALPGFVTTINAKAKNPAAAQAFLEFMGTPEASAIYADGFKSVPVLPNDQYTPPAELEEFAALVAEGKGVRLPTLQAEVQSTLNQQLQAMFLGNTTPEGVAESMQSVYKK